MNYKLLLLLLFIPTLSFAFELSSSFKVSRAHFNKPYPVYGSISLDGRFPLKNNFSLLSDVEPGFGVIDSRTFFNTYMFMGIGYDFLEQNDFRFSIGLLPGFAIYSDNGEWGFYRRAMGKAKAVLTLMSWEYFKIDFLSELLFEGNYNNWFLYHTVGIGIGCKF